LPKNQKFKQETTLLYQHHKNNIKRILLKRKNKIYTVKLYYLIHIIFAKIMLEDHRFFEIAGIALGAIKQDIC